jgi:hypothetical protein
MTCFHIAWFVINFIVAMIVSGVVAERWGQIPGVCTLAGSFVAFPFLLRAVFKILERIYPRKIPRMPFVTHIETLALLLPRWQTSDYVVTFTDGDDYEIKDLDVQGLHDGDFEIGVEFARCLGDSVARREALEAGHLKTQRVSWTSEQPSAPVGKTYLIQEIQSIFDRTENYEVYTKAG